MVKLDVEKEERFIYMHTRWEHFSEDELRCKGTGEIKMDEPFMKKLVALRKKLNQTMSITSGYRHPAHNSVIGGARNSPHLYGKAVDVAETHKVVCAAAREHYNRVEAKEDDFIKQLAWDELKRLNVDVEEFLRKNRKDDSEEVKKTLEKQLLQEDSNDGNN